MPIINFDVVYSVEEANSTGRKLLSNVLWLADNLISNNEFISESLRVTYIFQQFDESIHPIWDWHRIFLISAANGFPYTFNPKNTANRLFYAFRIFGAMLHSIIINAHFQLFMTRPSFQRRIHSIREFIEQNFTLAGDSLALECLYK